MTLDITQIITDALNSIGDVLSQFTNIKVFLFNFMTDLNQFDFKSYISPYLSTIKYVIGTPIYNMTIGVLQISLFVGLSKAFYQIVHIIMNSGLIKKPLAIIKDLLKL